MVAETTVTCCGGGKSRAMMLVWFHRAAHAMWLRAKIAQHLGATFRSLQIVPLSVASEQDGCSLAMCLPCLHSLPGFIVIISVMNQSICVRGTLQSGPRHVPRTSCWDLCSCCYDCCVCVHHAQSSFQALCRLWGSVSKKTDDVVGGPMQAELLCEELAVIILESQPVGHASLSLMSHTSRMQHHHASFCLPCW